MQHQQQSQSEISAYVRGLDNVHCVLQDPSRARDFYANLFGPPQHTDGEWSEFKIAGFDFAVTAGERAKYVITLKVERLVQLHRLLEERMAEHLEIQHGDYGDYVEVCPSEGFCLHFFEARKKRTIEPA